MTFEQWIATAAQTKPYLRRETGTVGIPLRILRSLLQEAYDHGASDGHNVGEAYGLSIAYERAMKTSLN